MRVFIIDPCYLNDETTAEALTQPTSQCTYFETDQWEKITLTEIDAGDVDLYPATMKTNDRQGEFAIDSGQFICIPEPALKDWRPGDYGDENDYTECCEVTISKGSGWLPVGDHLVYASRTAHGDGSYPVRQLAGSVEIRTGTPFSDETA